MTTEKEYMTLAEAAQYIGMKRASIYNYMKDLKIKPIKFGRDRRKYVSLADVKRMKEYKAKPWIITEEDTGKHPTVKPEKNVA
jgi:predicted DNA-binding transcriptional regulator AlpA